MNSCEFVLFSVVVPCIFQIPIITVCPENIQYHGTKRLTKWMGGWAVHYNGSVPDLIDQKYPIVLLYNGIHHYTSTEVISVVEKNLAYCHILDKMAGNMVDVSQNLFGIGDKAQQAFQYIQTYIQEAKKAIEKDPTFASFAVPAATGHPLPSASSLGAAPPPAGTEMVEKYKYHCDICDKKFQRSNELQNHKTAVHGEGFQCNSCDHKPFSSKAALKVHQTKEHGEGSAKMYTCPETGCTYSSNRQDAVTSHRIKQHGYVMPDEEKVQCTNEGCTQKFSTKEQMTRHKRLTCQKATDVACLDETCDKKFKNVNQMKAHYKSHTEEYAAWKCGECDKQLSSKQAYDRHMKRHT